MEKRVQKIVFFFLFAIFFPVLAQEVSQERTVRFALWAQTEIFPGVEQPQENAISLPVQKIKEVAPFLLSGLVYGWNFEYVPYDKARGVAEFFDFAAVRELSDEEISSVQYEKPWIEDSRLFCWVTYRRSEAQVHLYKSWQSIMHPRIKGTGYADLSEGFAGIQKACAEALKSAVREYERKWIKSKPKEVSGTVFMCAEPKIGIDAGRYKVTLDFFMEKNKIIEYKTF